MSLARVEEGPASRAVFVMWREALPGAGSPLPGGAPCSYGVGVRLEGAHWLAPLATFRAAVEGAWSWDLAEFPAAARTWRFRRYGVDLGVRFGRGLGFVLPSADVGPVLGAASRFVERPALVAEEAPVFDPGYPAVVELLAAARRRFGAAAVAAVVGPGSAASTGGMGGFSPGEVGPVIQF